MLDEQKRHASDTLKSKEFKSALESERDLGGRVLGVRLSILSENKLENALIYQIYCEEVVLVEKRVSGTRRSKL